MESKAEKLRKQPAETEKSGSFNSLNFVKRMAALWDFKRSKIKNVASCPQETAPIE